MLTRARPAAGEPQPGSPADLLRASGQDAARAATILTLVLAGVLVRLATGSGTGLLGLPVFLAMAGAFATSATFAVRTRLTILRTLGEIRVRIGAPLNPGVPWLPTGLDAALPERELHRELRRLVGAAYRCHDLSLNALVWAFGTVVLFTVWVLV